ncbi:unnamed protein product [Mytilus coruscus]|uniref:B box-type domain-containing protein n=1 Tax=Mytilus coruscus TaxID=42192 RepID=A0A6J8EQK9_MYTCO|nr:unnamed protein product [Mytilus coruscus]
MTTSPRHMHLANARMANNTSMTLAAEVTKLVRQHFDPPPAPPYRYQKVCQKTSQTLLHERPESTWQENYDRRDNHMKCGYYSLPNEPYRNVGGQFDLDPFDLVLKTISKNLDVKVWDARSRQGTATKSRRTPQKKRRQSLLPPISNEKVKNYEHSKGEFIAKTPTKSECQLLEDKQSDGGISTIKDQLYDLQTAKKYVLAGQSFENFIKHLQEIKANKVKPTRKNEMVLIPMSDPLMELPVNIADTKLQSLLTPVFGKSSTISLVTNKKNFEVKTNTPTSIQLTPPANSPSINQDVPSVQKIGSTKPESSKMTMIENRKMSVYLRSTTSVMAEMDIQAAAKERKERMKRIHMEYLEAMNIVLNSLCNMKTKDLKSKTPLSFDHLKQLRKDTIFTLQTHGDGNLLSRQSRPYKNASVVSTVPSETKAGGFAGLFAKKKQSNMFVQVAMLPAKLTTNKFSQLLKPKQKEKELKLESWEDFLAVDPHTPMPEKKKKRSFATGVMSLVKAVQWHKKLSESTNVGNPSPTKNSTEGKSPEVQDSTAKIENIARLLHNDPNKKLPAVKKTPIWQKIAAEKVDLYEESKSDKKEKIELEDIVCNMRTKFINMKHKHKQETDAEVQKLERERLLIFKYKYGLFSDMSSVFDEHCLELAHARNNINDSVDIGELIKPSLWYSELKEKAIKVCGSGNDVEEIFQKMGRHSMMDGKSVHLGKAKLCLIVMSLPAHEICTVAFQTAIKFVLERIMLHDLRNFTDWLQLRKVPYNKSNTEIGKALRYIYANRKRLHRKQSHSALYAKKHCEPCETNHKLYKVLRNHKIIPLQNIEEYTSSSKNFGFVNCEEHPDKNIEIFCKDHSKPCCTVCATVHHRKCDQVITVDKATSGIKQSIKARELMVKLEETSAELGNVILNHKANMTTFEEGVEVVLTDIAYQKDYIFKRLNDLN